MLTHQRFTFAFVSLLIFSLFACEEEINYAVYCQVIAECGEHGYAKSDLLGTNRICYCVCDEGWYGKSCEFQKSECKGTLKNFLEEYDIDKCDCICPSLGPVSFDPPDCSSINISLKKKDMPAQKRSDGSTDYFPLNKSNLWFYDTLDSLGEVDSEFGMQVESFYARSDTTYKPISFYIPDSLGIGYDTFPDRYFEIDAIENEIYTENDDNTSRLFLYHSYNIGDTLVINNDSNFVYDWGTIEVPAGEFENCIGLINKDSSGVILAPDVGMVAYLGDSLIFAQLKSYDLYCDYSVNISVVNESCPGANDGRFNLEIVGDTSGIENLNYNWSGPTEIPDGSDPSMLGNGYYFVTISNEQCEASIDSLFIDSSEAIDISLDALTHVSCFGDSDGAIEVSFSGGIGTLAFTWNDGEYNSPDLSDLPAGTYTLEVSDSLACIQTLTVEVEEPNQLVSLSDVNDISCYGLSDGSIDPNILGGNGSYSYSWSTGSSATILENLDEGSYGLSIIDALGCTSEFSYEINEPDSLQATSISTDVNCYGGNDGSISLDILGGTLPYSINWSNGQTGDTINDLTAGIFAVSITDASGCMIELMEQVQQADSLSLALSTTQAQAGMSDGTASVEVTGGTEPYTYLWDDDQNQTTEEATDLSAGEYNVIVTDANGCTKSASVMVSMATSTENIITKDDIQLFPTPGKEFINIHSKDARNQLLNIKFYNLSGQEIQDKRIFDPGSTMRIDIHDLVAGLYLIRIETTNGTIFKNLIKTD